MVKQNPKTEAKVSFTPEWKGLVICTLVMVALLVTVFIITRGTGIMLYAVPHMVLTLVTAVAAIFANKLPRLLLRIILTFSVLGVISAIYLAAVFIPYALHL
jgi:hypothetical protein